MTKPHDAPLAAAVLFEREEFREPLRAAVAAAGVAVSAELRLSEIEADVIGKLDADVLVVNLETVLNRRPEILERILNAQSGCLLIFNDAEASIRLSGTDRARWARHLAAKILGRDQVLPPRPEDYAPPQVPVDVPGEFEVWVLGASIGGPEAVRTFLGRLEQSPPAAFILAQHIGADFVQLMTSQLNQVSRIPVRYAQQGDAVLPGQALIVPVDNHFSIDDDGRVQLGEAREGTSYSPCLDQVLMAVTDRYAERANAIIFSGMATDGVRGAVYLMERGGEVWVQHPDTCVVSSMVDGALATGQVKFVGSPAGLAARISTRQTDQQSSRHDRVTRLATQLL